MERENQNDNAAADVAGACAAGVRDTGACDATGADEAGALSELKSKNRCLVCNKD